ncbi:hypothetical protein [Acidisphaera sp. L21]|uniref:hypothetical protein n=1 Tax=Acidisphaera sp. L21 TaxID=1641851 RepID=UPI00131EAB17|nr:hypothetical protein [Acidisphaera sp. L21]
MTNSFASLTRALPVAILLGLSGCGSVLVGTTQEVSGLAGAGIASSVTKSATAATAIGLGVAAGANAGLQYAERRTHRYEQDRIAEAAGAMDAGSTGAWSVSHSFPIEADEHGQVAVLRTIGGADMACKEIIFSVQTEENHQPHSAFYTAAICRDGDQWKWASAEPATERWGALQ